LRKRQKKTSKRRKLLYWLLVDVVVAAGVIGLLFYKPAQYSPATPPDADPNADRVHPYLTHDLMPQLYNGAQSQQPFTIEVVDAVLKEAIAKFTWPQETEGVTFSAPDVRFQTGSITLMGTADVEGAALVITVELQPQLGTDGQFSIELNKVKIGAMNITPLAKMVAEQKYQEYLETVPVDTTDTRAQLAAALLNGESFDPVFQVEDKWIRLKCLTIEPSKLIAHFVPAEMP
jgi:hypothetical protein